MSGNATSKELRSLGHFVRWDIARQLELTIASCKGLVTRTGGAPRDATMARVAGYCDGMAAALELIDKLSMDIVRRYDKAEGRPWPADDASAG